MTNTQETIVQQSKLIGLTVLNRNTVEKIGQVKEFRLDPIEHRVVAIACKSGFLGRAVAYFNWQQVTAVGDDSIMLSLASPAATEAPADTELFLGYELWTDAGNKAGAISDYCIDRQTGSVVAYLFTSNGWQGIADGTYSLAPSTIVTIGSKRLVAQAAQVETAEQFSSGLSEKMTEAAAFIKQDLAKTRKDISTAAANSQTVAAQLQSKAQTAAAQAQEKLADVSEQAQAKAQQLAAQTQAKFADVSEQAQTKTQQLAAQAQEKFADVSDRVQAATQTAKNRIDEHRASQTEAASDSQLEQPQPPID